jgi:hypothetical protein
MGDERVKERSVVPVLRGSARSGENILHQECNWAMLDTQISASFRLENGAGRIGKQGPQWASSGHREWMTLQPSERASGETDPSVRSGSGAYRVRMRSQGGTVEAKTSRRLGFSHLESCTSIILSRHRLAAYRR